MIKFTFIFIIVYWFVFRPKTHKAVNRYITICATLFLITIGCRNEAIFGDTYGYVQNYNELANMSIKDIINRWPKDPLFYIASSFFFRLFGVHYTYWLLSFAFAIVIPVTKLIRNYSVEPMYSWLLFIFVGYLLFVMAGLRQVLAISLCMVGFLILMDNEKDLKRRKWWFVFYVFFAALFHGSAIFCLVGLFLVDRPINGLSILFYILTVALAILSGSELLQDITFFLGRYDERYLAYGENMRGSNTTYFIQQLLLVVPSLYFMRKRMQNSLVATMCHLSIIGLLCVSLSMAIAEMFRLSYYFAWANIILFPMAIKEMRKTSEILPMLFLTFFIVYLVFINGIVWETYYFWFEDASNIIRTFDF